MNILKLINNNQWRTSLKKVKEKPFQEIIDQKNLFHMACIRGIKFIIEYYLKLKSLLILQVDDSGNNGCHMLAQNGWYDLLLFTSKYNPDFLKKYNNEDKLVINYVMDAPTILKQLMEVMKKNHIFNSVNYVRLDGRTFLIDVIDNINDNNIDKNKLDILTEKELDWTIPKDNPPLIYVIHQKKNNLCNKLLDLTHANINISSSFYVTPLILAVINNEHRLVKKIIKNGADVNYGGRDNEKLPITIAIKNKSFDLIDLLINLENIELDITDSSLSTPIFYFIKMITKDMNLYMSSDQLKELLKKFVEKSNLLIKNIDNMTPLHMLVKYKLWNEVRHILFNKKLDISTVDKHGNNTLSYLGKEQEIDFIKLIEQKRTIDPLVIKQKKIDLPTTINSNFGLFNPDSIHNIIYFIYILTTYQNVMIPLQFPLEEKQEWDSQFIISLENSTEIIANTISLYNKYFYSFLPCILYWKNKNIYYKTK